MRRHALAFAVVAALSGAAFAQQPASAPTFEVASIKPMESGAIVRTPVDIQPGGRLIFRNTVKGLIGTAYQRRAFEPDPAAPRGPVDGPSLFTALQEQAGLKLTAGRAPVDVLVVERVERPSPD